MALSGPTSDDPGGRLASVESTSQLRTSHCLGVRGVPAGIEHWTVWLNVPFSAVVGWVFVSLEKVGENSSNPFEGGANDVPISSIARRIEIEMRIVLGEQTDLKPVEAKYNILL
jgi:predicted membrane chloride channel (bestrophin family)